MHFMSKTSLFYSKLLNFELQNAIGRRLQKEVTVYRFKTNLQHNRLERETAFTSLMAELFNDKKAADLNWLYIKECLSNNKLVKINEHSANHSIFSYLLKRNMLDHALSFSNYVVHNATVELNLASVMNIFLLYATIGKLRVLNEEEKRFISDIHQKLRKEYTVLDPRTNSHALMALVHVGDWQQCLKILEEIKLVETPQRDVFSSMVDILFNNGHIDKGWEVMTEMWKNKRLPSNSNYSSWLNWCTREFSNKKKVMINMMEQLLYFIAKNEVRLDESAANIIGEAFKNALGWKFEASQIDHRGKCSICQAKLKDDLLTPDEFNTLQRNFMDQVIIGDNVFHKSSPKELNVYINYLKEAPRYDIVLDALNIVLQVDHNKRDHLMLNLLKILKSNGKRVLILGRRHLYKLKFFDEWKHHSVGMFMLNDLSDDDPFFLYATMYGGPHTDFMSSDMMRSHTFRLKDRESQLLFLRWQRQHQHKFILSSTLNILEPIKYSPFPQKDKGWHIPYQTKVNHTVVPTVETEITGWICMQPPLK